MNEENHITELYEMMNIGIGFSKELIKVGIKTPKELRKIGSKEAFLRLKRARVQNLNLNKLAALEGAIQNIKKYALDEETKSDLENFYLNYEL